MPARPTVPVVALSALLALPPALAGQSAAEVLRSAAERYAERMAGVENYTVVQEVMGFESTTYFERVDGGEYPTFLPRRTSGVETSDQAPRNPANLYDEVLDRATHEGTEAVNGRSCHVIAVDDLSGIDMSAMGGGEAGSGAWTPQSLRMWIDQDQLVPRKMEMRGTLTAGGSPSPATTTVTMDDYREVEGMLHPFTTRIDSEGMAAASGMSESERAEMQAGMEQMREQLRQMPESQREMMERMMGDQLDRMKELISSGSMAVTVEVREIRVNEGPPAGN